MDLRTPRYGQVDREYARRLATTPPENDGPVWMVNLMSYREVADYTDGRDSAISGREADDRYNPTGPLRQVGAEIVFVGEVDTQLLGHEPKWDRVAVVRYPTRRSFIEMQSLPSFKEKHAHKDAGMAATIIIGGQPMVLPTVPDTIAQPDWSEVDHPPTDDDGPVVVLHVIRFADAASAAATPEDMEAYTSHAMKVAGPHGGRIATWLAAEGTIVGDGRSWHQARFNEFPSRAAFMAVVLDPSRLEAQKNHREVAIADTYTMILRPTRNALAASARS